MALKDLINELKQGTMPFVRGLGTSATLGAIKYPSAALMVLIDQVRAENPRLSFKEALELVNAQQATDRAEAPIASLAGETLGSLAPGVGAARVATTLPAALGAGAAQGAVAGFNERQDIGDAGLTALLGGATVGAGRLIDAGRAATTRAALRSAGQQRVDEAASAIMSRRQELATPNLTSAETKKLQRSIRSLENSAKRGRELIAASEFPEDALFKYAMPLFAKDKSGKPSFRRGPLVSSAKGDILGTTRGRLAARLDGQGSNIANTLLGAGTGYWLDALMGEDEHALMGALLGGALGNKTRPFQLKKAGAFASLLPAQTVTGTSAVANTAMARALPQGLQTKDQPVEEDFDSYFDTETVAPIEEDFDSYFDEVPAGR